MPAKETESVDQEIDKLEIHPLIEAQEKTNENTVEFRGFVGTGSNEVLRLYTELDTSVYVDIPKDAVVHLEKDEKDFGGVKGKARVFVSATKEVTEVSRHRVAANESSLSLRSKSVRPPLFLQPPLIDREGFRPAGKGLAEEGKECVALCEATFAVGASEANQLRNEAFMALAQGNLNLFTVRITAAIAVRNQAVALLRECLRQCPVLYPDFEKSISDRVATFIGW